MNIDIIIASLLITSLLINAGIIRWQVRNGLAFAIYQGMRAMLYTTPGRLVILSSYAIQIVLFSYFSLYLCLMLTITSPLYTLITYWRVRRAYTHQLKEAFGHPQPGG